MRIAPKNQPAMRAGGAGPWAACIAHAAPAPIPLSAAAAGIATAVSSALVRLWTIATNIWARGNADDAVAAQAQAATKYCDGYLPPQLRRRAGRARRKVECVVIENWMMWRT